ncbi:DNA primase [Novosphingobium sp.]|uniref:DNA primase n=1 Tax=Novosphingobium sp. TaxID=1874826 RepID=UPI0025D84A02|nr:DNA primase [Novosphingobium sp.]
MALTPQWLDELRTRVTLSGVIGRTTRIQKAGREWKACCPFHNEKTPSFTINDEKGFYHCFGCGAHGDVIRWMTDQRGLPFMDAVKELAVEAGMEVPAPDPRAAERAVQQQSLHDVMAAAQAFFVERLASDAGAEARAYLARRGFPAAIVREFGFGFAPDSRTALKAALPQFPVPMLIEAGLLISVEDRDPYDRFRNRLMLPITDARGRVIAFGGRILDAAKTDAPKYLNSPETPLFDKGRTLYNLQRAAPASRTSGRIVVVEGYMDVVALAAAGIGEAVAPLGTALTEEQIERLWRVHECPVLCFDGDAAGKRAAMRAATRALPLLRPGHSMRVVTLPEGLDPDDLIKRDGPSAMQAALAGGRSLVELVWEAEREALALVTPEDKAGLKARLLDHVSTIAHPDIRSLYRRDLLERFDAFAFAPRERKPWNPADRQPWTGKGGRTPPEQVLSPTNRAQMRRVGSSDTLLSAVIAGLILHPAALPSLAETLARVATDDERLGALVGLLISLSDRRDMLETAGIETILAERRLKPPAPSDYAGVRLGFLDPACPDPLADLTEALGLLVDRPALDEAIERATERLVMENTDEAFEEQQRLLKRKLAFEQRLLQMARSAAEQN